MTQPLKKVLMERDDLSASEAQKIINDMKQRVMEGEDPEELLYEEVGLEPDYIFDILPF